MNHVAPLWQEDMTLSRHRCVIEREGKCTHPVDSGMHIPLSEGGSANQVLRVSYVA